MEIADSKRKCTRCIRKECFVNKYYSDDWKNFFSKNKTTYIVKAGERIFSKGEPVEGIYTVYSGYIKVIDNDEKSERIVDLITKGNILGYRAIGKRSEYYSVSAEALSECEITFFSVDTLRLAIESNKEFVFYLIDLLTEKLRKSEIINKEFQQLSAKEKIVYSLNEVINVFGFREDNDKCLNFIPKRKDIASLAGTTYETVVRVLSDLDKEKKISIEGKRIKILDREYFKNLTLT